MSGTLALPRGHLSPNHLFPGPTAKSVRNLEPLSAPCPGHPPPAHEGRALDRARGLGSRDVFHAATFLIAVKSLQAAPLLRASFAPRPGLGALVPTVCRGRRGARTWRSVCLLLLSSPLPLPCGTAPVTPKLLLGLGAGAGMGCEGGALQLTSQLRTCPLQPLMPSSQSRTCS